MRLEILKPCQFFWLRSIHAVDISQCCAKCFIGQKDNRVYYGTLEQSRTVVDLDVFEDPKAKAYYLCGLSRGYVYDLNTHVAFVPDSTGDIHIENDRIILDISNARRIHFWDYTPTPAGVYTKKQRACRNWIFANYIKDGMPL